MPSSVTLPQSVFEAVQDLAEIRRRVQALFKGVQRKRSWRLSEKAMAAAKYAREENSLLYAIGTIISAFAEPLVYLKEVGVGDGSACWVVCAKGDPGATPFGKLRPCLPCVALPSVNASNATLSSRTANRVRRLIERVEDVEEETNGDQK